MSQTWEIGGREYRVVKTPKNYAALIHHGNPYQQEPLERLRHLVAAAALILVDENRQPPPVAVLEDDLDVDELARIKQAWLDAPFDLSPEAMAESITWLDNEMTALSKDLPWSARARVWGVRRLVGRSLKRVKKRL